MTMFWTYAAKKAERIAFEITRVNEKIKSQPTSRKLAKYKEHLLNSLMNNGIRMASDKKSYLVTDGGFLWSIGKAEIVNSGDVTNPRYVWVKGE